MNLTNIACINCGGKWNESADYCENCGVTGIAVTVGPSVMRRISKRFRYTSHKMTKKRRKHGRSMPARARLVIKRRRLRQSEAAQLARRQADTLRTGQPPPQTAERLSAAQDVIGRES